MDTAAKKIGVLVSGGGTNLQALIDAIENGRITNGRIAVVVSNRSKAYGLQRAEKHNIPAVFISKKEAGTTAAFNQKILEVLKNYNVDLVVLAGYMSILTPEFVAAYPYKIINIHPALIPSFCGKGYYGLNVHEAVINYGVKITGATVHFVDEGTDTGAIILQKALPVNNDDTPETLQKRLLAVEHQILPEAVQLFCNNCLKIIENKGKRPVVKLNY